MNDNGLYSQSYGFNSHHVWMWKLEHKEGWAPKNWCFWTLVLEKTLESPLDCKEIKPVNPKGNQSWMFIGRTAAKAPILWPPDGKGQLIGKTLMWGTTELLYVRYPRLIDLITGSWYPLDQHLLSPTPVQLLSCVWLFETPWTAAHQVSLSITNSRSLPTHVHWVGDAIQPSHPLGGLGLPYLPGSSSPGLL